MSCSKFIEFVRLCVYISQIIKLVQYQTASHIYIGVVRIGSKRLCIVLCTNVKDGKVRDSKEGDTKVRGGKVRSSKERTIK